jgi:hypothetical protein
MKSRTKILKQLFLLLNILLTSAVIASCTWYIPAGYEKLEFLIDLLTTIPFILFVFLQCLFIPQIAFVVLFVLTCIVLIRHKKTNSLVKRDVVHIILLILWSLIAMYPAWYAFLGAMSV